MTAPGMMAPIFSASAGGGGCGCSPAYVTGDRTGSITVSESGIKHVSAGPINNLVDGGLSANDADATYFQGVGVAGHWVAFDFGAGNAIKITEATWRQDTGNTHGNWKWQGSNNGSDWTDIGGAFVLGGIAQVQTELSGNAAGFRHYRLLGVSGNTSTAPYLIEIEFKQCTC